MDHNISSMEYLQYVVIKLGHSLEIPSLKNKYEKIALDSNTVSEEARGMV